MTLDAAFSFLIFTLIAGSYVVLGLIAFLIWADDCKWNRPRVARQGQDRVPGLAVKQPEGGAPSPPAGHVMTPSSNLTAP